MISTAEINKQVFQTKKEIGLELRCRREKKGLSLAEAASVCGLSPNRIMRIENGYAFSFRHIFILAAMYGVEAQLRLKLKRKVFSDGVVGERADWFELDTWGKPEDDGERGRQERVRQVFDPSGSPFERGESSKEDPLTFRLALNEG